MPEIINKRIVIRISALLTAVLLLILLFPAPSEAYFNRGTVKISLGRNSVTTRAGGTASVSVSVSPIKQDQLPGCGMAECPQTCGDGCLDANGECTCGGTEYKTYYSEVSCSSSKSSVATASYANGTLTVSGHEAGNATITLTGKMRQYTNGTAELHVTVENNSSAGADSSASSQAGNQASAAAGQSGSASQSTGTVSGSVNVEQAQTPQDTVVPAETADDDTVSGQESPEGELRDTERGKYRFVTLTSSTDIPKCFQDAANEQSHLVFQKKNGDNVEYSWTFDGSQLNPEGDYSGLNLNLGITSEIPDLLKDSVKGKNVSYLSFDYSGDLPAEAELYVNVTDSFDSDEDLYLYQVGSMDGKLTEEDDQVSMSNGYATFYLKHCSNYILTDSAVDDGALEAASGSSSSDSGVFGLPFVLTLTAIIAAAVVFLFFFFGRQSRKRR